MNRGNWSEPMDVLLRAENLHKSYFRGGEVPVLRGVDLSLYRGETVSIIGSSGSGKSTLLHLLGTLDSPSAGAVYWKGARIDNKSQRFRDRFRNQSVGFIFQFYHLLPELSALENIMLPALIRTPIWRSWGVRKQLRMRAEELLEGVGLSHRRRHRPRELSGGEMQRVAIARALFAGPELLLADEPTGNLDAETGEEISRLILALSRQSGLTVLLVTHDAQLACRTDRVLRLTQGRLEASELNAVRTASA